ncbi:MAG TPA: zinc ribbon domain-containing protein [Xanthomonadales bacterium]|nr:zinc ribbon domain-containing protein [Xanthomonadales bacterium]
MPIYEYRCQQCGHELEKLQRMSDDALTDCPECGKSTLRRLISAAGFRLKGAGWYETDFKQGNKRNLADGGGGSESSPSSTPASSDTDTPKKEKTGDKASPAATSTADSGKTPSSTAGTS